MTSVSGPSLPARIITLRFDPGLIVSRHARCHSGAEYLAQIASGAGSDTAMAAREISACLFEVFELVRGQKPSGLVELSLWSTEGGVDARIAVPAEPAAVARYMSWLDPGDETRDPLVDPCPGDGVRELVGVHGVEIEAAPAEGGLSLELHIPLHAAAEAAAATLGDGEAHHA